MINGEKSVLPIHNRSIGSMGLSNNLRDASMDSLPLFVLLSAASFLSRLRSLLLLRPPHPSSDLLSAVGSRLHSLTLLADHLSSNRPFPHHTTTSAADAAGPTDGDGCIFCLDRLEEGDQIRRLACRHVFHSRCLDGWFDALNLSCPLCRSPIAPPPAAPAAEDLRIGAELVAWLSPC